MRVLIFQLDGKIPNIACMRISAHHKSCGDIVQFRWTGNPERELWDRTDRVYGSAIFKKTLPAIDRLRCQFPDAILGGTGVALESNLEEHGITTLEQDYSLYPKWRQSIGFTQRGCRLKCGFCVVPKKEGSVKSVSSPWDIWRGDPWPRELILLDNDFFGQPDWRDKINTIRNGNFKVSFNQGINARMLTDEAAEAIGSVNYRDDSMKVRRIYTAWDNAKDEETLFRGLNRLVKYGVKPDHIMVYILVGYWPGETEADRLYRWKRLRDFGARPYPMPFVRSPELCGFQRWIIGAYDKRISWEDWKANNFRPEGLAQKVTPPDWCGSEAQEAIRKDEIGIVSGIWDFQADAR